MTKYVPTRAGAHVLRACAAAMIASIPWLTPAHAASGYAFTSLADSSGAIGTIIGRPAINDAQQVAFAGRFDDFVVGLFTAAPSVAVITRATGVASGPYQSFGDPDIRRDGTLALGASLRDGTGAGVFTGAFATGGLNRLTDSAAAGYTGLGANVAINASGVMTYFADSPTIGGIYAGSASPVPLVAGAAGPLATFRLTPHLNDAGTVVFAATTDLGERGVFAVNASGGPLITIADSSGMLNVFNDAPVVNNAGFVVFSATFDAGGTGLFMRRADGTGNITTLVDSNGPLTDSLADFTINDAGQIAYIGSFDAGGSALFSGPDLASDAVIRTGDALFGSTVTALSIGRHGLNNKGDIAFNYTLANGLRGVGIAGAVPEPASWLMLISGVLMLLCRSRRHCTRPGARLV